MTALGPPLAGRAAAVTQCRILFTAARIIRQCDGNNDPKVIKLNLFDIPDKSVWTPATELFGGAMGRSMRIRINDFQTRNELAGFLDGKSRKLVTTP